MAALVVGAELRLCDYPVRRFSEHRQAILDTLIGERDRYQPSLVFCPSRDDCHQDHAVCAAEAMYDHLGYRQLGRYELWESRAG